MDPTAPTTYRILVAILTRKESSQRELVRDLGVSLGQANKVFRWLEENNFVERGPSANRKARGRAHETYVLTNPTGLLRVISVFRPLSRFRQFTLALDVRKDRLLENLRKRLVVFCLGTALERYSRFYRADEVTFYALSREGLNGTEALRRDLASEREGISRVTCYLLSTKTHGRRASGPLKPAQVLKAVVDFGVADKTPKGYFTTKVQTVVDLFCDGKAFAAKDLLKDLWGIEL